MDPILLVGLIQAVLQVVVSTTASSTEKAKVLTILSGLSELVQAGTEVNAALVQLTDEVKAMVATGHDPTAAQQQALADASQAAHNTIQGTETSPGAPSTLPPVIG